MICPNCGSQNEEGALFCNECGTPLTAPVTPEDRTPPEPYILPVDAMPAPPADGFVPPVVPPYDPGFAPPMQQPFAPYSASAEIRPAIAAMKKVFSSPMFIVAVFAQLASVIVSFISSLANRTSFTFQFNDTTYRVTSGGVGSAVLSLLVGLVTTLGLCLILVPALNKEKTEFPTAGFTILKVFTVIGLVLICIGGVFVIALLGMMIALGSSFFGELFGAAGAAEAAEELKKIFENLDKFGVAVLALTIVIVAGILALYIVFVAKRIKTLNTYKKVASSAVPSDCVSPFYAVILIIIGVFMALGTVSMAANANFLPALSSALGAAYSICIGITVFKFRTAMREEMAKVAPAPFGYPPQGYAPQGYAPAPGFPPQGYAPEGGFAPQNAPVVCPRCGGVFAPNLAVCPHCGLPRV